MKTPIALLAAAAAIGACSTDPVAMAEPAHATSYPQPYAAYELEGAPLSPVAVAPVYEGEAPYLEPVRASTCEIAVRRTSNGVRLKAVANLNRYTSGEYSFVITKFGGSGSSDINQGGPFDARAGRTELSSSEFSMGRGAGYRATL